jgi:purine nucleosidase
VRIHLDTDLGGDPDDLCALAMLLGWPDVELTGITTTIDFEGRRAAMVRHCLQLVGRVDIPVSAGSRVSMTTGLRADPYMDDDRMWPASLPAAPPFQMPAINLMLSSVDRGATLLAIGPYTNLAALERIRPGSLSRIPIVVMGGWVLPPAAGLPDWGPDMDWNVQWDTRAAKVVAGAATDLTLVTLPATLNAHLRAADLPRLRAAGPLGDLVARQSEAHAANRNMSDLGRSYPSLPDDLLNVHYDPVACAVALGWSGAAVEEMRLITVMEDGVLRFQPHPDGRLAGVVVDVDGPSFTEAWLAAVEATWQGR